MSVYKNYLPEAFPHSLNAPRSFVMDCVHALTHDQWKEQQSSFAVTSDVSDLGTLNLWLSDASRDRLYEAMLLQKGSLG